MRRTVRGLARGVGEEIAATVIVVRRTSAAFWIAFGLLGLPTLVGLLPLGRLALLLQCVALLFFGVCMLMPEVLAREFRKDDDLALRDRESDEMVTHLPVLIVLFGLPVYLVGQAILFHLTMRDLPGVLPGEGWSDAWLLSLNNLLYTEIFLDVVDIFRVGLVSDPVHRLGQAMVFVTRALLSVAFIRALLVLGRAAWYRAQGLGRGTDQIAALRTALYESDAVEVRHRSATIAANIQRTVDTLVARLHGPDAASARNALGALREWAGPHLDRTGTEDAGLDGGSGRPRVSDLSRASARPRLRPRRLAAAIAVLALLLAGAAVVPGWPGLAIGASVLLVVGWLVVTPRGSVERAVELGLLPAVDVRHLTPMIVTWSAAMGLILLATAVLTFGTAAAVDGSAFVSAGPVLDRGDIVAFVTANLLRLQVFLSAPDLFAIGVPPLEQRPILGSVLTLVFRTFLNLGTVAVLLTAFTVAWSRAAVGTRLVGNDELRMRAEALRGGHYGPQLARHHAEAVVEELWTLLIEAGGPDLEEALLAGGAYEWIVLRPPAARPGNLVAAAAAAAWLAGTRREGPAEALLSAVEAGPVDVLFAPARVRVAAYRALALARTGHAERASAAWTEAATELARMESAMHPDDRAAAEATLALAGNEIGAPGAGGLTPPAPTPRA